MNTKYYCIRKYVQIVTEVVLTILMALVCSGVVCCYVNVCVRVCGCVWVRVCVLPWRCWWARLAVFRSGRRRGCRARWCAWCRCRPRPLSCSSGPTSTASSGEVSVVRTATRRENNQLQLHRLYLQSSDIRGISVATSYHNDLQTLCQKSWNLAI